MTKGQRTISTLLAIVAIVGVLMAACSESSKPQSPVLTKADRDVIKAALEDFGYFGRYEVKVTDSGWLAVYLHLDGPPANPRAYGESAIIAIRNALYPTRKFDSFRLSLRGPNPGPDLIQSYGAARFTEARGRVRWEDI